MNFACTDCDDIYPGLRPDGRCEMCGGARIIDVRQSKPLPSHGPAMWAGKADVWQMVPLPATAEMNAAGETIDAEMRSQGFAGADPDAVYYAMLDASPFPAGTGASLIATERARQLAREGWSPEHDDAHTDGEIALAALCYVYAGIFDPGSFPQHYWPWDRKWWKPGDNRRNLVKAGALIAAEIDRLDRKTETSK